MMNESVACELVFKLRRDQKKIILETPKVFTISKVGFEPTDIGE